MKKLHMNSLNLLPSQKVLTQKRNKHNTPNRMGPPIETGSKYHRQI